MSTHNFGNSVLYLIWSKRVYTKPDVFLGVTIIPIRTINFFEGRIFRIYEMTNMGKQFMNDLIVCVIFNKICYFNQSINSIFRNP